MQGLRVFKGITSSRLGTCRSGKIYDIVTIVMIRNIWTPEKNQLNYLRSGILQHFFSTVVKNEPSEQLQCSLCLYVCVYSIH